MEEQDGATDGRPGLNFKETVYVDEAVLQAEHGLVFVLPKLEGEIQMLRFSNGQVSLLGRNGKHKYTSLAQPTVEEAYLQLKRVINKCNSAFNS